MALHTKISGAGLLPCALCILTAMALCGLMLHVWPAQACARELANVDSPAWCARHSSATQTQCLRMESACRAALPDMNSAGGCPSRELEACVARQDNGGSWCGILCCIDPDHPACRAAAADMPQLFSQPDR